MTNDSKSVTGLDSTLNPLHFREITHLVRTSYITTGSRTVSKSTEACKVVRILPGCESMVAMSIFESIGIEADGVLEGLVIFFIVLFVVIFIYVICYHAKRKVDERRKKEEEEMSFFSFNDALSKTQHSEVSKTTKSDNTSVFSVSGNPQLPSTLPIKICQTPANYSLWGDAHEDGVMTLGHHGEHVSTPMYPPSYFSTAAPYDSVSNTPSSLPHPPPPYR